MTARTPPPAAARPARSLPLRALDVIERIGNRLPAPATLFVLLAVAVVLASWLAARLGVHAVHPRDGSIIHAVNLLDRDGVRRMFTEATKNFMGFAPLGIVLVAMIGVGVAEPSGLVTVSLRALVMSVPRHLLTAAVVFAGILAHLAADAGIVVMPPIGAMLFAAAGRNPLAGLAAAFAGVVGGFSANVLPSTLDVLLIGFTQEAVKSSRMLPGYEPQVLGNYFFFTASTPLLVILGTWVTHRFVEPRLGPWEPEDPAARDEHAHALQPLTRDERRGLNAAFLALAATLGVYALLVLPPGAPLRADAPDWLGRLKPFFDSMVIFVMILFFVPGLAYGIASGRIRSDHDVAKMTGDTLGTMGTYIVLAFAAAQFVAYFTWSNLGAIIAISGATLLKALHLGGGLLLVMFVLFATGFDLIITSASAKWAVVAPVFVPMFALMGITPEGTQAVFRIGASCGSIVTPLLPYMPFILAAAQRYDRKAGTGTLIAMMVPYSITFLVFWTALLLLFYWLRWPIGPGVGLRLPA